METLDSYLNPIVDKQLNWVTAAPFFVLGTTGIVPEKTVEPGNYSTGNSENTCKIGPLDDRFWQQHSVYFPTP